MGEVSGPWFDGWGNGVGLEKLRFGFDGSEVLVRRVGFEGVINGGAGGAGAGAGAGGS